MALRYPDRLESNNPSAYGIVPASQISGHRTVANLTALYALKDCILSESGNNTANDALGQEWYVVSEQANYRLTDWANRTKAEGWQKVIDGDDIDLSDYVTKDNVVTSVWIDQESDRVRVASSYGDGSDDDGNYINAATTTEAGVMSAEDKDTLDHLHSLASERGGILVAGNGDITVDGGSGNKVDIELPYGIDQGDGWDNTTKTVTLPAATTSDAGVMTAADKKALDELSKLATPEGEAGILVVGGSNQVTADSDSSDVIINIPFVSNTDGEWDKGNFRVTIPEATTTTAGVMSATDKTTLDDLDTLIRAGFFDGGNQVSQNANNVDIILTKSAGLGLNHDSADVSITVEAASSEQSGVMTTTMFNKLNGVADEATADSPISEIDINRICV